jgi:protein KRI1
MSQVKDRRPLLEEEEDDDDSSTDLQINSRFAEQYELRKQREELTRYKRDEGSEDSDASSSEDEDEDGALLTTRLDVDILKTIHAIRTRDPKIYNPNVQFFHEEEKDSEEDSDEKDQSLPSKPKKRYQDVVREQIIQKMNAEGDETSDDEDSRTLGRNRASYDASRLAYDEQQQQVRQDFLKSVQDAGEEEFVPVRKTKPLDYGDDDDGEAREAFSKELERLKELKASSPGKKSDSSDWKDPRGEVSNGYDFLLQYFEKRPWKKNEKMDGRTDENDEGDASSLPDVEQADEFEATYNFRYETATDEANPADEDQPAEPASGADHSNIPYARSLTMETLRRKDDRRVQKRQERLERKALERKMKEEQLKRLKNAKRQEMNKKLQQVRSVLGQVKEGEGGNDDSQPPMDEAAILKLLEEDFDPEKFESIMAGICSDDYYNQNDTEWKNDLDVRKSLQSGMDEDCESLVVGPDDDDGGLYDTVPEVDDDDHEHFGDVPEENDEDWGEEEEWQEDTVEHEMERKIKTKMEEELYKLDYEDIVAGMPTRFKYRSVPANNYGLSTMEILCARDTTLKQYVSLKKLAPYVDQEYVIRPRKRQKFRQQVKQELQEMVEAETPKKKRRKKGNVTGEDAEDAPLVEGIFSYRLVPLPNPMNPN